MKLEDAIRHLDDALMFEDEQEAWMVVMAALKAAVADKAKAEKELQEIRVLINKDREACIREGIRWDELLDEHLAVIRSGVDLGDHEPVGGTSVNPPVVKPIPD